MTTVLTRKTEGREVEDYFGWPLRDRLKLLAFDARLAGVPQALLEALWEAIDRLGNQSVRALAMTAAHWGRVRTVSGVSREVEFELAPPGLWGG